MSVSPWTYVVFGAAVENARRVVTRKGARYDEITGKPYQADVRAYEHTHPDWVIRLLEERKKFLDECYDDELYEKSRDVVVRPIDDCQSFLLIGKLLLSASADESLRKIELPLQYDAGKIVEVLLANGVLAKDIGVWIGTAWR